MAMTEEQQAAYSFAISDIKNGHNTLWVERLKRENPELYEYAMKRREK